MKDRDKVALLILLAILLIKAEPSNVWADAALGALGGSAMVIASHIIFRAIEKAGRK